MNQAVSRKEIETRFKPPHPQGVTHAADGVQELRLVSDLVAQRTDEDVERIVAHLRTASPPGLHQDVTRNHTAGAAHHHFENAVLRARQRQHAIAALHLMRAGLEHQVLELQIGRICCRPAPGERANTSQEDVESKWFGQIVVSAGVEAADDVGHGIARRHHDGGHHGFGGAQTAHYVEAVAAGQHDVEDDDVQPAGNADIQGLFTVERKLNRVPLILQRALQQTRHPRLILGHQHSHGNILMPPRLISGDRTDYFDSIPRF